MIRWSALHCIKSYVHTQFITSTDLWMTMIDHEGQYLVNQSALFFKATTLPKQTITIKVPVSNKTLWMILFSVTVTIKIDPHDTFSLSSHIVLLMRIPFILLIWVMFLYC